jgi:cytochrome c
MVRIEIRALLLVALCLLVLSATTLARSARSEATDPAEADAHAAIRSGPQGDLIRYGRDLILHTRRYAGQYVRAGMEYMPFDRPGTLTDQEAVDVSAYVLSHPRPHFRENVQITFPSKPAKFF